jgi:competence protein ComEA
MARLIRSFALLFVLLLSFSLSPASWAAVDVNSAAQTELETLPGIGPSKANAIIEYRSSHGPFQNLNDLDQVPGIGPATLANIGPLVSFSGKVAAATPGASATTTSSGSATRRAVNVNVASQSELESLPGIGPSKAAAIVAFRNKNGAFKSCDDLDLVNGIGPATLANLSASCTTQ